MRTQDRKIKALKREREWKALPITVRNPKSTPLKIMYEDD